MIKIEGILVPPAIDHRILVHLGEDHFIVAHDRAVVDDRKCYVADNANAQLDVIRIVRGCKVKIQLSIHCPEIQHQRCVLFLHLRGIDRELVLEIPGDHTGNRDRLEHRIYLAGTTPVVVAENKAVCTGADFDLIDVLIVTACGDDCVGTLDRHLDLGWDHITVVAKSIIGGGRDLEVFVRNQLYAEPRFRKKFCCFCTGKVGCRFVCSEGTGSRRRVNDFRTVVQCHTEHLPHIRQCCVGRHLR